MDYHGSSFAKRKKADLLVVPFWQNASKPVLAADTKIASAISLPANLGDFKGKEGEVSVLYTEDFQEKRVLLLGLGEAKKASVETLRRSYGILAKFCLAKKLSQVNLFLPSGSHLKEELVVRGVAEGMLHVNFTFDKYKTVVSQSEPVKLIKTVCLLDASSKAVQAAQKYCKIFEGVNLTKTLVNSNADDTTPQYLAEVAQRLAKTYRNVQVKILNKKQIEAEKMGLLLAVNRGSVRDPVVIVLKYQGAPKSKDHTVFVGKGVTYDTGGLNIKVAGMETMKCDMAGAAACLGLVVAAANIGLKANFSVVIAATENMLSATSYKPGDVFTSALGTTVEVDNTDAEGRLTLADALVYAKKYLSPTRLVDISTLTGGILIAFGEEITGMMGNDEKLIRQLKEAGEATYERLWQMPVYDEFKEMLKSDFADIKNAGGRQAGSITAAIFLKEFVGDTPWVHLDIAGTAYTSKERRYLPKHATGVGVRLFIELLEGLAS
jgi:leucyl aminopeptidase